MTRGACVTRLQSVLSGLTHNGQIKNALATLSDDEIAFLEKDWPLWARADQLAPETAEQGDQAWRVWLILGGRGAGKTRTGAEWIRSKVAGDGAAGPIRARRIALIGETLIDARRVMVEGISGLLAVHRDDERPEFHAAGNLLRWPNGAVAHLFSADDPDSLRGPQFDAAWCDEVTKWRDPDAAWDMLQFALRLGDGPQVVATTTPRPLPILQTIMNDRETVVTRVPTARNAANLSPQFVAHIERRYSGTALWRQEVMGEIVEDQSGTLWRRCWIDDQRTLRAPELLTVVVAVDPPVTATKSSDSCGIVVAGLGEDRRAYVLADRTIQGRPPQVWARTVIAAYQDFAADRIVAEVNQGGDLIATVLKSIEAHAPIRMVRATRGKWLRAEPVASLYAEGRVAHVGRFDELEDQMSLFRADGKRGQTSPDRVDALVWALTDLMLSNSAKPAIRPL